VAGGVQPLWGAVLDDAALFEDDEPVGHDHRLDPVVGDDEDRSAKSARWVLSVVRTFETGSRVEGGQRLVEEQQHRVSGPRPG